MTDGKENITWETQSQPAKQEFGKPHYTGTPFACHTLAFYPAHHIYGFNSNHLDNKFLPP
jgi:hypothetical protein